MVVELSSGDTETMTQKRGFLHPEPSGLGSVEKNGNKNEVRTMLAPGSTLVPG